MKFDLQYIEQVDSTNDELKRRAKYGAAYGTLLYTHHQTHGKGSRGRAFYSPESGLYFSLLLPPIQNITRLTPLAAVAAARACEAIAPVTAEIKWVNDIVANGKKVCGILTEVLRDASGQVTALVVGVGVNLAPPEGGFPSGFAHPAGALLPAAAPGDTERFLTEFCAAFDIGQAENGAFLPEYRARCRNLGRTVTLTDGPRVYEGIALTVDDSGALVVRLQDGTERHFSSGEVTSHI